MTNEQLRQRVRDLVILMTGFAEEKVIIAEEGGDRPEKPYAATRRISTVRVGTDTSSWGEVVGGESTKVIAGERLSTFSVQFFGDDSDDFADTLFRATTEWSALSSQTDFALIDVEQTLNLAEYIDTEFEPRAGVDLRVRWTFEKTLVGAAAGGTIERAFVNGIVDSTDVDVTVDWP
jgi:hypothetical protein